MDQTPGWRDDPDDHGQQRFWDGTTWTDWTRLRPSDPEQPASSTSRSSNHVGWYAIGGTVLVAALVAGAVALWGPDRPADPGTGPTETTVATTAACSRGLAALDELRSSTQHAMALVDQLWEGRSDYIYDPVAASRRDRPTVDDLETATAALGDTNLDDLAACSLAGDTPEGCRTISDDLTSVQQATTNLVRALDTFIGRRSQWIVAELRSDINSTGAADGAYTLHVQAYSDLPGPSEAALAATTAPAISECAVAVTRAGG